MQRLESENGQELRGNQGECNVPGRGSKSIVSNDTELKKGDKDLVGLSE